MLCGQTVKLHFGGRTQTASFMGKSVTVVGIAFTGLPGQLKSRPMALISRASNNGYARRMCGSECCNLYPRYKSLCRILLDVPGVSVEWKPTTAHT